MDTPRYSSRESYKAYLASEAQRRLAQATAQANAPALAERIAAAWKRVAVLREAGEYDVAEFVAQQAREMEGN